MPRQKRRLDRHWAETGPAPTAPLGAAPAAATWPPKLCVAKARAVVRTGTIVVLLSWPDMASLHNKEPGSLDHDRGWTIVLLVVACTIVALYLPFFWEYAHG